MALPWVARVLTALDSKTYTSLEALGVCVMHAVTESQIADLSGLYRSLGKRTFAACDKQADGAKAAIEAQVEQLFMHEEKGIEDLILKNTTKAALERFADLLDWPPHLVTKYPDTKIHIATSPKDNFGWTKGN